MSLKTTIPENEARLKMWVGTSQTSLIRAIRFWPFIDATEAPALVIALNAVTTVTEFYADGVKYSGDYKAIAVVAKGVDDRSVTIEQTFTLIENATASADNEHSCMWHGSLVWYYDQPTFVALPEASSGIIYERSYVSRNDETGLYTYAISKRERLYVSIAEYISEESLSEETKTTKHYGVRAGDIDENGAAVTLQDMTVETGYIKQRERTKNEDCTQNIVDQKVQPKDQTFGGGTDSAAEASVVVGHTEGSALGTIAVVPGSKTIVRGEETPTRAGNVATRLITATPKNQAATSRTDSAEATSSEVLNTENTSALGVPSHANGYLKRNINRPTAAGNNETKEYVEAVIDQTAVSARAGAAIESDKTTLHTQASGGDVIDTSSLTATAGTIRIVEVAPTAAGLVRQSDRVIQPKNQTSTSYEKSAASTTTDTLNTESTALASPTQVNGYIKRSTNKPTEAGNVETHAIVELVINQTSRSEEHDAAEDTIIDRNTQGDTIADKAAGTGTYRSVTEIPTAAGKLATVDSVTTPKPLTGTAFEKSSDATVWSTGVAAVGQSDTATATNTLGDIVTTPTISTAGTIQRGSSVPTRIASKYVTSSSTETGKYQFATGTTVTYRGTDKWSWGRNATWTQYQAAITAIGTLDATTNNSCVCRVNGFGLLDYEITKDAILAGTLYIDTDSINVGGGFIHYWREYGSVYFPSAGRCKRCTRVNSQGFQVNIRQLWSTAFGDIKDIAYPISINPAIENHGKGFVVYIPQSSMTLGSWTVDETGAS